MQPPSIQFIEHFIAHLKSMFFCRKLPVYYSLPIFLGSCFNLQFYIGKFFTNLGTKPSSIPMSLTTGPVHRSHCQHQCRSSAPPIQPIFLAASRAGTHSRVMAATPASLKAFASRIAFAPRRILSLNLIPAKLMHRLRRQTKMPTTGTRQQ